jgi:hypothetical protein
MELTQQFIDDAIKAYNSVTKAHKRAPVVAFVKKQLQEKEEVALSAGQTRWSSALVFKGSVEKPEVEFRINPALPKSFQEMLNTQQEEFYKSLRNK